LPYYQFYRNTLVRCCRKKKQTDPYSDPPIDGSQLTDTALNHTYFVLEKHTKESDINVKHQLDNKQENYALPKYSAYEAIYAEKEDDYHTTVQSKSPAVTPGKPGNVYNTFNDFQQPDDYDYLGDHKKKVPRVTDNDYSTTQAVMSPATDDDTYNHLNEEPKTSARPDNVYGMTRVNNDYDC